LSRRFYDAALRPLGLVRILDFEGRGSDYGAMPGQLGVELTITAELSASSPAPGMHVCFRAHDREAVRAFHAAALRAGGRDDGTPGRAPCIIPTTMPPSSWIPTGTASRLCAMHPRARRRCEPPPSWGAQGGSSRTSRRSELRRRPAISVARSAGLALRASRPRRAHVRRRSSCPAPRPRAHT
jgi:catechol 2,3-dioxygenase-like lactoylglutathione lyase family enzyme